MSFTPLRSKSRNLYAWFATRPDLFTAERSPRKTTGWAIVAGIMAVVALLVYLNPTGTVELLGGRVRGGLAIAGAFALPPIIIVVSVVMIFLGARRWRVKGGGVLLNPVIHGFSARFPVDRAIAALREGSADSQGVIAALTAMQKDAGDERLLTIWSSDADRAMYIGVLRVDGNVLWIDSEPITVDPDRYFDAKKHDLAAALGKTSLDGV
ncbi:hypothetical protein [Microbacterium sp. GCS4]|uniref:hypothetical protein n=1 Tax=Microbacterium sp. GCS4 TaxID=1692239 RepID=UPI0006820AFC|nr:hypothetical protein [Microbacterium sp. GCS4]KNY05434.1 hypothetical protein AKH00_13935 [Microbacterium sp. GCS4]